MQGIDQVIVVKAFQFSVVITFAVIIIVCAVAILILLICIIVMACKLMRKEKDDKEATKEEMTPLRRKVST